jgi:LacI family transcriptional regulator
MAVSQKQIAEKLGVSIALVSRVLSGKAEEIGITPQTIDRVLRAAEEMGYVPSAAALSLKGKATRTIGVVVYDFKDPFFGSIIEQLQIQAHKHNYSLILTGFINRIPQEQDLQPLYKHSIDGLIVIGTDPDARWLEHFNLPVARIGHGGSDEKSVRISIDEKSAAHLILTHLIKTGRRTPTFVCADLPAHRLRRDHFETAAKAENIVLETEQAPVRDAFAAGVQATQRLVQSGLNTDALICATDLVATGALNALREAGICVPDSVAVTGFDGIAAAEQFMPAMTTLHQPIEEIVRQAFNAVIRPAAIESILIPGSLQLRETA